MLISTVRLFTACLLVVFIAAACSTGPGEPDPELQQRIDLYMQLSNAVPGDTELKEEFYDYIAQAYRQAGNEEKAEEYDELSMNLLRMDMSADAYAQMVRNRPGLQPMIISLCDQHLARNPAFAHALLEKARAFFRMKEYDAAKLNADQALAVDPALWEAQALSEVIDEYIR